MPQAQDACGRQANHAEGRQPEESRRKREAQIPVAEAKDELEPDMSDVPQAREELGRIARGLINGELSASAAARQIRDVVPMLVRKPPIRQALPRRTQVTPELQDEIRAYARNYPDAQMMDIALRFDVNIGRVSEALREQQ
jgi:hypothetical protein